MQYGYFDDKNREYIITNPATPASWSNYLGSVKYGAIITNNAGGYSFYKSAALGRFMRFRTNTIPMDQPGRYIYIHDQDSKDFWSASWQPVAKPLDDYKTICRHGTAYTVIESEYSGIKSDTNYFVPLGKDYEYWHCKLENKTGKKRRLRLFTYVEYSNEWNMWMDVVNLQYTQYIMTMAVKDNIIDHGINIFLEKPDGTGHAKHTFLGVAGAKITGYDTDRKAFLGAYGDYSKPAAVINGICSNSIADGDNGCGSVQFDIELEPGESKEFVVVMGIGKAHETGKQAIMAASDLNTVKKEFNELVAYWHNRLEGMYVETPDAEFNSMMNMWAPYNCLITYAWSRAASLVYAGERDGLGYRDTVQDMLGVLHTIPDEAIERLELMITGQVSTGGAMPVVKPFTHNPGNEIPTSEEEYRSDDCMWLFNTIPAYVKETGDINFYNKILPYADKGKGTVLEHLRKAIEFNIDRSGAHGLPCGLAADWNDCLVLGQKGETVFVTFQLRYALKTYIEICDLLKKSDEKKWAENHLSTLDQNIAKHTWDGNWFLRAYRVDGLKYGTSKDEEGSIWLNPQTWAILSGYIKDDQAKKLLDVVNKRLSTDYGLMICDPPYEKADVEVIKATLFNKSTKENGSIFCHTQGWAVIAEAMLGNGTRAFEYFKAYMPASFNTTAEVREIEPYVYCQSIISKYNPRYGAARLPWLSGTASWSNFAATQYILGVQPEIDGIRLDPCVPKTWKEFKVNRRFRNKQLSISFKNDKGVEKGVQKIILNGIDINNNFILFSDLKSTNEILVYMG